MANLQTLKDWAKQYNMYTPEEIPALYRSEYTPGHLEREIKNNPIPEFFKGNKNYITSLLFTCVTQDKGTDREYNYIHDCPEIIVMDALTGQVAQLRGGRYKEKYWFFLPWAINGEFNKLHHSRINEARKDAKEPNKIGVFTQKKVQDWFNYLAKYTGALGKLKNETEAKNEANEQKIKDFIKQTDGNRRDLGTTVLIYTKRFEITFQRDLSAGYMGTQIYFRGTLDDVVKIESK